MNRRTFLHTTLAATAGTAFLPRTIFAADAASAAAVERVIAHYDYAKLHYSQFFRAESAWWRLRVA